MRQLKFRVWNGKAMTYPKTIELGVNGWNGLTSASYQLDGGGYCTSAYVMQFTGLLDKNSKEIYEGDIVKYIDFTSDAGMLGGESTIGQINWIPGRCAFHPQELEGNHKGGHYIAYWDFLEWIEVIGNIYENKDLIK